MQKFNHQLYDDAQFRHRPTTVYQAYAKIILNLFHPKSIIDFGCANALSLAYWQKQGINRLAGIEPATAAYRYMPAAIKSKVKPIDLRKPYRFSGYDLVNFTEVAEHIESEFETVMLKNVLRAVKNILIISWSNEPGGDWHVNLRSEPYVKTRLRRLGLYFEPELTNQLKHELTAPVFKNWLHWSRNIMVFSRTSSFQRVQIRLNSWLPSYTNKNVGYFAQTARALGFGPRWTSSNAGLFKRWHRVWLYPFEKHLLIRLLILKLFGNKVILKLDSQILPAWRAQLIKPLLYRVIAESPAVAKPFGQTQKLVWFSGGLPCKNIKLIKSLKINRGKIILYSGRQTYQKGFDRLKKIIPAGWKLKIATDLPPRQYYSLLLRSSIVVLPTRGEGWPNVFADAFYCRRLFLTTSGARCGGAISDKTFFCPNTVAGLRLALKKITDNLGYYYGNFYQLYDPQHFQLTGPVFSRLLKKTD